MKVGDLVKIAEHCKNKGRMAIVVRTETWEHNGCWIKYLNLGAGIVVSLQLGGRNPVHPTATVFWFEKGKYYKIAESLLEVVSETR